MAYCAVSPNVILPSTPAGRLKGLAMVEQLKRFPLPLIFWVGAALVVAASSLTTPLLWLTGAISGSTITSDRLTSISADVAQIKSDLKAMPRADQFQDLIRANAAQDGRIDVLRDEISALKIEMARMGVRLDGVTVAGRKLPGER